MDAGNKKTAPSLLKAVFLFDFRAKTGSGTPKLLRRHACFAMEDTAEVTAI